MRQSDVIDDLQETYARLLDVVLDIHATTTHWAMQHEATELAYEHERQATDAAIQQSYGRAMWDTPLASVCEECLREFANTTLSFECVSTAEVSEQLVCQGCYDAYHQYEGR